MAFGSFPVDVLTSVTPLDMLLPVEPFEIDFPVLRSSARHFHEDDKEYTLSLALPGVSPADLKLAVEDGMLTISGATKKDTQTYRASHRVRIPSDADPTLAKAVAENGILAITLPRRPKVTHEIAVASSNDAVRKAAEGDYVVSLPFPGVRPSDFKVVCEDSVLSIAVETNTTQQATKTVKRMRLPADADVSAATAAAEFGILTVTLPRRTIGAPEEGQNARSIQAIAITNGGAGGESPASST
ncbi:hypothetical protein AB1Y20_000101 [Prymnesium parvum]|uniref:SHSP domain-containing protein n=1 Tax=Prymnesium parvum TaxID=97485 RepID=A0AB34K8F7_PRYPA